MDGQSARQISELFFALMRQRLPLFTKVAEGFGLNTVQARILIFAKPGQTLNMGMVADLAGLGASHLTGVVDKLEKSGLMKRETATSDRRVKVLKLTRKGEKLREKLWHGFTEPAPWMLAMNADEKKQLVRLLGKALSVKHA